MCVQVCAWFYLIGLRVSVLFPHLILAHLNMQIHMNKPEVH